MISSPTSESDDLTPVLLDCGSCLLMLVCGTSRVSGCTEVRLLLWSADFSLMTEALFLPICADVPLRNYSLAHFCQFVVNYHATDL